MELKDELTQRCENFFVDVHMKDHESSTLAIPTGKFMDTARPLYMKTGQTCMNLSSQTAIAMEFR